MKKTILLAFLLFTIIIVHAQSIVYVKANAKGTNDGSTWKNAYTNIQDGINKAAQSGAIVWIASGTYKPTRDSLNALPSNKRNACFLLKSGVIIYGGFNGTETKMILRDPVKNQTILSGEIGDTTTTADNCYHVVYAALNCVKSTTLDGCMIMNGLGTTNNGAGAFLLGGTIVNCSFINNVASNGAAIYARNTVIQNCEFKFNTATTNGGAVFAVASMIDSCIFRNNNAINGAALYVLQGKESFCSVYSNTATGQGGGIYSNASIIEGLKIINNTAKQGGGIFTNNSTVVNTLVSNNAATTDGGGIYAGNGATFTNVTVAQNISITKSGGMYCSGTNTIQNTVFWNNVPSNVFNNTTAATFSNVALSDSSKLTGTNTTVFKLTKTLAVFINPADSVGTVVTGIGLQYILQADWQPQSYSQLIDNGNNTFIAAYNTDINGKVRIINSPQSPFDNDNVAQTDIGAFEAVGTVKINANHIIYVK